MEQITSPSPYVLARAALLTVGNSAFYLSKDKKFEYKQLL